MRARNAASTLSSWGSITLRDGDAASVATVAAAKAALEVSVAA